MRVDLILKRKKYLSEQTVGTLDILIDGEYALTLHTLEQEWNNNKKGNSCIPAGEYKVVTHLSPSHGECLLVTGTAPRTDILFHVGNFYFDSKGCILTGMYHSDINSDGYLDVANSGAAFSKLMRFCEKADKILLSIS